MTEALIGLGSNLGEREQNLRSAVASLGHLGRILAVSPVFETEPMYHEDQGLFLNCVVSLETVLEPRALLEKLQSIESSLGRERRVRYGPRTIDLDILFYGALVVSGPGLEIPHPRIAERLFVLAPLNEVRPELVHPVLGVSVSQMLSALRTDKGVVRRPDLSVGLSP
ncbi:MAG: 2-amino-4-hydroxy-6-hydroxymethyldihydropteridine diphosphokinase [Nitrososphaerota archaeon]|nr:2-amino-4-hydroxy-6-hydroxymethyldihydropteridine diphosphokinase [Nitrososphaerota archaeon]